MKKLFFMLFLCISTQSIAQIFTENFQNTGGTFPAGWTLINNDGLTPASAVNYVNNAWIIREDFITPVTTDSCAVSTSWYTSPGTADDWMITPQIMSLPANAQVSWRGLAPDASYADGYQVLVSTTTPTIAAFTAVYTVPSEAQVWTNRTVDLSAYAGQNIYLAWRNNSFDDFLLFIDDINVSVQLPYDVSMADTNSREYTITPDEHVSGPIGSAGLITNLGSSTVTNATMTTTVFDGGMNSVYNASSTPIASLAGGASSQVTVAGFTPTLPDVYTVQLVVTINENDSNSSNDTTFYTVVVSDSVYARDEATVVGTLGIGAGNGGQLGQQYEVLQTDDMTSVSFYIANSSGSLTGQPIVATVYNMMAGVPNAVIGQTDTLVIASAVDSFYTMPIMGGGINLTPGDYVVVLNEADSTLALGYDNNVFTPGKTWVTWPTNPNGAWSNAEDFGFNIAFIVRPNFGLYCPPAFDTTVITSCSAYVWAQDGNTYNTTGMYTATVTGSGGCDSTYVLDLTVTTIDNATSTSGATITANMAGANYEWIDCSNGQAITGETGQSFTATANGDYAVVVSMNGCSDTSACVTISGVGLAESALDYATEVYPNPANNQLTISFVGIPNSNIEIVVTDVNGKQMHIESFETTSYNEKLVLDVRNYVEGIYFVEIATDNQKMVERIVVTHK